MNMSVYNERLKTIPKDFTEYLSKHLMESWFLSTKNSLRNGYQMLCYCFVLLKEANPVREDG